MTVECCSRPIELEERMRGEHLGGRANPRHWLDCDDPDHATRSRLGAPRLEIPTPRAVAAGVPISGHARSVKRRAKMYRLPVEGGAHGGAVRCDDHWGRPQWAGGGHLYPTVPASAV
jgi:hypothetical protein